MSWNSYCYRLWVALTIKPSHVFIFPLLVLCSPVLLFLFYLLCSFASCQFYVKLYKLLLVFLMLHPITKARLFNPANDACISWVHFSRKISTVSCPPHSLPLSPSFSLFLSQPLHLSSLCIHIIKDNFDFFLR